MAEAEGLEPPNGYSPSYLYSKQASYQLEHMPPDL